MTRKDRHGNSFLEFFSLLSSPALPFPSYETRDVLARNSRVPLQRVYIHIRSVIAVNELSTRLDISRVQLLPLLYASLKMMTERAKEGGGRRKILYKYELSFEQTSRLRRITVCNARRGARAVMNFISCLRACVMCVYIHSGVYTWRREQRVRLMAVYRHVFPSRRICRGEEEGKRYSAQCAKEKI